MSTKSYGMCNRLFPLSSYSNHCILAPIKLPSGGVVIDIEKFLISHRSYVAKYDKRKRNKRNVVLDSYKDRLGFIEKWLEDNGQGL